MDNKLLFSVYEIIYRVSIFPMKKIVFGSLVNSAQFA